MIKSQRHGIYFPRCFSKRSCCFANRSIVRVTGDEIRRREAVVPELLFAFGGCSDAKFP